MDGLPKVFVMRKAFLFSVIFVLLFTIFLLLSVFYMRMLQMNELNLAQTRNITRLVYVRDDIVSDLLDYLELSVSVESNSTHTILNISDALPSPYSNPTAALNGYKSFINGTYSNQTNLLNSSTNLSVISLNTTGFESSPSLQFINSNSSLNLRYGYNNLSKNELIINGSGLLRNYSITMRLNETCLNSNCENATWAGGPPNIDSSTAGMWHFDEGSGTAIYDSSGNGNIGTFSGYTNPTWVGGKFGNAVSFDSYHTQDIVVGDSRSLGLNGSFTVELWFKQYTGGGMGQGLINKGDTITASAVNYQVWINVNGKIQADIGNGSTYQSAISSTTVQNNNWYHVAFTVDGSNLNLYINGVLENTTFQSLTPATNTGNLIIGNKADPDLTFSFDGTIDEVAIYSRAKSAEEIAADANFFHWDWGPIAINSNISAAWHFDEGMGNLTQDSSGNGNAASLSGTIIQTATEIPGGYNKAYKIDESTTDNPSSATTEMDYSKINTSNDVRESSYCSYSDTGTGVCASPTGSVTCKGFEQSCSGLFDNPHCLISETCAAGSCPARDHATITYSSCSVQARCTCFDGNCSGGGICRKINDNCNYQCNSGWYNCDDNEDNGCETSTPCFRWAFHRFVFNLSDYDINSITSLTYCHEGYYTGVLAWIEYYNISSGWSYPPTLPTLQKDSEAIRCVTVTSNFGSVIDPTSGLFQFAATGRHYSTSSGTTWIYTDYAYVNITFSSGGTGGGNITWVPGKFGSALQVNSSGWVEAIDSNSLDITNQLTIEAWVKPDTVTPTYQTILYKGDSSQENYGLYLKGDELYFEFNNSEGNVWYVWTTSANLQVNEWYHVAAVADVYSNYIKLYVNGSQAGENPYLLSFLFPNNQPLKIGASRGAIPGFNGTIDEVAIYSRAKSAEEIAADINPIYVSLDVRDLLNNQVSVRGATEGYINPGGNNTFYLKTGENGNLNMTAGDYSGFCSLRLYVNNTRANLLLKTVQEGVSSIQVVIPAELRIYQQLFRNLIIAEK
jgi:hypothetical protein